MHTLVNRFEHMPEVKRIVKDHKVPMSIKKAKAAVHVQKESKYRKENNRKRYANLAYIYVL